MNYNLDFFKTLQEREATMKRKRILLFLLTAVIISLTFIPTKSNAEIPQGWYTVSIIYAGPLFDKILLLVSAVDGSFANQWLELNPPMQNPLLASALTVVSMQKFAAIYPRFRTQN